MKEIFVSHSGKQYVHRFIQGLLNSECSVVFCTPLWFQSVPAVFKFLPIKFKGKILGQIQKRQFSFTGDARIISRPWLFLTKEIKRRIPGLDMNTIQFQLEKDHDLFAAHCLKREKPQVVVGYEISSCETFEVAKKQHCITLLDLAQVHCDEIVDIAKQFPDMAYILDNPHLQAINERKQKEYALADYIITLSDYAMDSLVARGFHPDRVFKVTLGFQPTLFTSKVSYNHDGPLRLMICGTDLIRKGLLQVLTVMQKLLDSGLALELTIIGPSSETKKAFNKYINNVDKIRSHIRVLNFIPHSELVQEYQRADIFVFPSYLDSWAMTVVESMACGTPVIVSENTGSKEAVQQGGGRIVPVGDLEALEDAVNYFYHHREELQVLGLKAREIALQYTWDNYSRQLGEIFKKI